jgi:hypothetical protein
VFSLQKFIKVIKKYQPKNIDEMRDLKHYLSSDTSFRFVGEGAFRNVYKVRNQPVVVKFSCGESSLSHTLQELKAFLRMKKSSILRKHVPKIYYADKNTGLIVMRHYSKISRSFRDYGEDLNLRRVFEEPDDLSYKNIAKDGRGTVIFLDAGCVD